MNNKLKEIATENENRRQALYHSVNDLSQQQLDFRPNEESWSIGEILNHLAIVENMVGMLSGQLLEKAKQSGLGPDPNDGSVLNSLDQYSIELRETKVKAPAPAVPKAGINKTTLVTELDKSRAALVKAMEVASNYDLNQLLYPHPFFGDITLYQWLLLVGKHEHRHTNQINEVKASNGFPA